MIETQKKTRKLRNTSTPAADTTEVIKIPRDYTTHEATLVINNLLKGSGGSIVQHLHQCLVAS